MNCLQIRAFYHIIIWIRVQDFCLGKRGDEAYEPQHSRRIAGIWCIAMLLGALTGCSSQATEEKTVIRVLYLSSFKEVEALVESTYDDIDLQVEISPYSSEQLRRLERGVGPDLVVTMQPDSNMVEKISAGHQRYKGQYGV